MNLKISLSPFGNAPNRDGSAPSDFVEVVHKAEAAKLDTIWLPERYSGSLEQSRPLTLAVAGALGSESINFATGSLIAPYYEPEVVRDSIGHAKIYMGERLRLALGAGWDKSQFSRYSANFENRYSRLERTFSDLRSQHDGAPRSLMRTISKSGEAWRDCGNLGLGVYCGAFGRSMNSLKKDVLRYRGALLNSPYTRQRGWVACMTHFYLDHSDEHAVSVYQARISPYILRHAKRSQGEDIQDVDSLVNSGTRRMVDEMGLIGSRETIMKRIAQYAEAGIDELVILTDYDDDVDHRRDQIEALGKVSALV
ncbi:LLM class flavin-dependent oxidoreductase [Corynebacterium glyciniphilum]|uniref:LLM class flavin-dependent oxidoreductase n=1 Tax=Corynebacterium glyciniphilum TaxID=1404244 RepID=UPI00264CC29F|nr:LLM class flavin-dependent oxidoreductase [Corynebacterium glyciniphilum]MDN6704602.1 LLM class flavin-dependent oxidoreductase [Corynebacterium glyciniphilum]